MRRGGRSRDTREQDWEGSPEAARSEDPQENGAADPQPAGNGDSPVTDHYYVSVIQVQPPEYEDSIFVAYTENRSNSDQSAEKAVGGLVQK